MFHVLIDHNANHYKWKYLAHESSNSTNYGYLVQEKSKQSNCVPCDCVDPQRLTKLQGPLVIILFAKVKQEENGLLSSFLKQLLLPPSHLLSIWCHYGGQLNYTNLTHHWSTYSRLDATTKAKVLDFVARGKSGVSVPLPFSWNQRHLWHSEFEELRTLVGRDSSFDAITRVLDKARDKALYELDFHGRLNELVSVSAAFIVFQELRQRLSQVKTLRDWQTFEELFDSYGFGDVSRSHGNISLQDHYIRVNTTLATAKTMLAKDDISSDKQATSLKNWKVQIEKVLDEFIGKYTTCATSVENNLRRPLPD